MASLSVNIRHIGGVVAETPTLNGYEPMRWVIIPIHTIAWLWDRHGQRTHYRVTERLLLQGAENVKAYGDKVNKGTVIYAIGQGLPAHVVAADSKERGLVTLATTFQIVSQPEEGGNG